MPVKRAFLIVVAITLVTPLAALSVAKDGASDEATIYRDEYGIPHVFARTLEAASFPLRYPQAEDRLEELLKNYRRANGKMAEVFGPEAYRGDVIQRMWRHEEVSRDKYNQVSPKMRACIE